MAVNDNNKYDEVAAMRNKKRRKKRTHLWIILGVLAAAAVIISVIAFNMKGFTSYKQVGSEAVKSDEPGAVYAAFNEGYVRSSHSGTEYVDASGNTKWNETGTFSDPKITVCGEKIFVADMGGNSVDVFDASGHLGKVETPYSIYEFSGTEDGRVAIMTQDNNVNYLELYEMSGEPVYSIKTSLSGDGYPLAFDVTGDGKMLVMSFVKAETKPAQTGIRFYDFSGGAATESSRIPAEFSNFDGELNGDICCFKNGNTAVVSEHTVRFYGRDTKGVSLKSEEELFEEYEGIVKRVLKSSDRIALILSTEDAEEPERLIVYSDAGKKLCDTGLTEGYDKYVLESGRVMMTSSNRFAVYTTSGNEITKQLSDKPVSALIGNGAGNRFFLVSDGQVQRIKLS